ncbi:MAG TPA: RpiB/LacA/LacB family sugar-phosphate isomerase [Candidatus Woesebacteria bacterium]|nr:RpiB/LacA/LacB family sugar-phosphate isomerase [Candidatus Woesebacteria bacterium]
MKIYLGADHGGFALKEEFKKNLTQAHPELSFEDCGALVYAENDDYPLIAFNVAQKVAAQKEPEQSLGILFCRSGSGMVIAANKVKGIRAVELYSEAIASHAKSHNQANVIAMAGDYLSSEKIMRLFEIFLSTPVDQAQRHRRRLAEISNYENSHSI